MALKIPYDSTLEFLDSLVANLLDGADLHLYSNNHAPANADVVGDYTECTFPGYAAINLTGWPSASLDASNRASVELALQTFTGGTIITPEDIYGIYVTDAVGNLLYAELNPAGVVSMASNGQSFSYLPRFTFKSTF